MNKTRLDQLDSIAADVVANVHDTRRGHALLAGDRAEMIRALLADDAKFWQKQRLDGRSDRYLAHVYSGMRRRNQEAAARAKIDKQHLDALHATVEADRVARRDALAVKRAEARVDECDRLARADASPSGWRRYRVTVARTHKRGDELCYAGEDPAAPIQTRDRGQLPAIAKSLPGAPVHLDHDDQRVLGVVESARVVGDTVEAVLLVDERGATAIGDNFRNLTSLGYNTHTDADGSQYGIETREVSLVYASRAGTTKVLEAMSPPTARDVVAAQQIDERAELAAVHADAIDLSEGYAEHRDSLIAWIDSQPGESCDLDGIRAESRNHFVADYASAIVKRRLAKLDRALEKVGGK